MRMRSQYSSPGARWVLFLAAVAYGVVSGAVPVLHFSADGSGPEVVQHASGLETSAGGGGSQLPHAPDDLDCLYCQVLTSSDHPGVSPAVSITSPTYRTAESLPDDRPAVLGSAVYGARAPPA